MDRLRKIYRELAILLEFVPDKVEIGIYYLVGTTLLFIGTSLTEGQWNFDAYIAGISIYIANILMYEGKNLVLKSGEMTNKK